MYRLAIIAAIAGGAAFIMVQKNLAASAAIEFQGVDTEARISAFLATIRAFESNDNYYALVGAGDAGSLDMFPYHRWYFTNPATGKNDFSTAAGAYQITKPTFDQFSRIAGVTDFSPSSQDLIARAILGYEGAIAALQNNDIETAFALASRRWASLPGSQAMQNPKNMQTALNEYAQNLG